MKKTVIKYFASWCNPCSAYGPIFDKVTLDFKDEFEIKSIDIENDPEGLSITHKIKSIPHTVILQGDTIVDQKPGLLRENQLRAFLLLNK